MFNRKSTAKQLLAELCFKCHVTISCCDDYDNAAGDGGGGVGDMVALLILLILLWRNYYQCTHFMYDETVGESKVTCPLSHS